MMGLSELLSRGHCGQGEAVQVDESRINLSG